jgi:hypothetical protein
VRSHPARLLSARVAWALAALLPLVGCEGSQVPPDVMLADATADRGDASDAARDATPACRVDAPIACPTPAPRYGDVAPILQRRCLTCHDGKGAEWPLTSYGHVSDWRAEIRSELLRCSMPPLDAGGPMPEEESRAVLTWILCGLPP